MEKHGTTDRKGYILKNYTITKFYDKTFKRMSKKHSHVKFESLKYYLKLAEKFIKNNQKNKLYMSEDLVSHVATSLMLADWEFDENHKSKSKLSTLRFKYANVAIYNFLKLMQNKKDQKFESNKNMEEISTQKRCPIREIIESEYVDDVIAKAGLTMFQYTCFDEYFNNNKKVKQIASSLSTSTTNIYDVLTTAIIKIRKQYEKQT